MQTKRYNKSQPHTDYRQRAQEMVRCGEAADFSEACSILAKRAARVRSANRSKATPLKSDPYRDR